MSKAGYTALFMDNDAIVLSDPFRHTSADKYDLEGLSDWVRSDLRPTPWVRNGLTRWASAKPLGTRAGGS